MSIQQSVNQAINVGAALYTQTPTYEKKKAEDLKQSRIKDLKKRSENIGKVYDEGDYALTEALSKVDVETSKELVLLDPSKENIKDYGVALEVEANFEENRREEEEVRKQTQKAQEKKDFKEKVAKEVTQRGVAKKNRKRGEI